MGWKNISKPVKTGIIVVAIFFILILANGLINLFFNYDYCKFDCYRYGCESTINACFVNTKPYYFSGPYPFLLDILKIFNIKFDPVDNLLSFFLSLVVNFTCLFFLAVYISSILALLKPNKKKKN